MDRSSEFREVPANENTAGQQMSDYERGFCDGFSRAVSYGTSKRGPSWGSGYLATDGKQIKISIGFTEWQFGEIRATADNAGCSIGAAVRGLIFGDYK